MTPEQRFDIVLYRLNSAKSLLDEIKDHIERGYYNTAMNRMYYACFFAVAVGDCRSQESCRCTYKIQTAFYSYR